MVDEIMLLKPTALLVGICDDHRKEKGINHMIIILIFVFFVFNSLMETLMEPKDRQKKAEDPQSSLISFLNLKWNVDRNSSASFFYSCSTNLMKEHFLLKLILKKGSISMEFFFFETFFYF